MGTQVMIYFFAIFLCFFSMITHNFERSASFFLAIVMGVLTGFVNPVIPDYLMYQNYYYTNYSQIEIGYEFLQYCGNFLGFSYVTFRTFMAVAAFIILWFAFVNFSNRPAIPMLLYAVSIFPIDVIQIRNELMIAIVLFAYSFLFKHRGKASYILVFILLLIALSVHSVALIFFVPYFWLLFGLNERKSFTKIVIYILVLLIAFSFILKKETLQLVVIILSNFSLRDNAAANALTVYTNGTGPIPWAGAVFLTSVQWLTISKAESYTVSDQIGIFKFFKSVFIMGFVALILLPLSPDYIRITRNVTIFFFILISMFIDFKKVWGKIKKKDLLSIKALEIYGGTSLVTVGTLIAQVFVFYPGSKVFMTYVLHL
ncbi:hypothetical protein AO468_06285 [Oenococcus oeni]|uniref:EpsG family protein n=1 Tax=Oenococcus oeni TaxID=1247 RepID=UPI000BDF4D7B|nr:EpsG family protein [Oenococcus oeni]PDH93229.1 hypothetical protein AO468_06285 [Oenococcus oeni]